ncbi:MAG: transposase [Acidobacteria bacterium]|nr:transposase [Acidobacteriota bacterium]
MALDEFVVMPNHFHGIVHLLGTSAGDDLALPDVVHRFKSLTTRRYLDGVRELGWAPVRRRLWLRNYFEQVIGGGDELGQCQRYIRENPSRWAESSGIRKVLGEVRSH